MASPKIPLYCKGIVRPLAIAAVVLVILSAVMRFIALSNEHEYFQRLSALFYVDAEANVPTFFSIALLLIATLLLTIITLHERAQGGKYVSYWMVLSFGFLLMAMDEGVSLHEKLVKPIKSLLGPTGNLGVFFFVWVVPALALVVILGLYFIRFLVHLPSRTRSAFLLAASLYLGGAIGAEMISGIVVERVGTENMTFTLMATFEEGLEISGVLVLIRALLTYIGRSYSEIRFVVEP